MAHFDFAAHKAQLVQHYAVLWLDPGWTGYVDEKLASMAGKNPELWGDMPALVQRAVDERGARA